MNQLITITSDLGNRDYYLATLKGCLYRVSEQIQIIDINNEIPLNNIETAAFVIKNAYLYFPEFTFHILGVSNFYDSKKKHVALKYRNHYFLGTDNGIFSLLLGEDEEFEAYNLENIEPHPEKSIFPARDIFPKAVYHILKKGFNDGLGQQIKNLNKMFVLRPTQSANFISGFIKYIDNFGNLITDIDIDFFLKNCNKRKYQIQLGSGMYKFSNIYLNYSQPKEDADLFAIFNSSGLLEIALKNSSAAQLMGLNLNDPVRIEFY